ncbi:ornithine carbamoyltransferase [Streptomyces sp. FH025]|uniref:ornithine carbamoyltransferase n=1 Tax=Streptomyces sp. FH025 TaxID=2815937 RepID=UPI001A9E5128|nr:ornithine carbamoyltransferase [Streptomyces sp. FH025]MBO1413155.1 ornithine carbamoyltransferase [Streptomyces sp. FH025]
MSIDLRGRHYLREQDFTPAEIHHLLDLAAELKAARRAGTETQRLTGRRIALIFEKNSTRTRCAFEVAAADQGATTTYLGPDGSHIGHKETIADTARVLGRMYDGIEYRGFGQDTVTELARHAGVPVFNGLTDACHPTQSLCDVFTMREHSGKPLERISFCYLGDARNNTANSLMAMGSLLGMDVRIAAPKALWPDPELVAECRRVGEETGARLTLSERPEEAVRGADYLYTDVWVSMGEDHGRWKERIDLLLPYRVTAELMAATGNPDTAFLHCLPALHDRRTDLGAELAREHGLDGLEVTDEVFESPASLVFDQAENRMHTIKAVLVATLGRD